MTILLTRADAGPSERVPMTEPAPPAAIHPTTDDTPRASGSTTGAGAFDLAAAYDEHAAVLFGFAVNALRDRGLAEDCVQETFLRAWRSRADFSLERAALRTWLFAIIRNVVIDTIRARQRVPKLAPAEALESIDTGAPDPLDRLELVEGLARLSPEHRAVVVAVHLDGRSYAELAAETGISAATLRTRCFYALRALRGHVAAGTDAGANASPHDAAGSTAGTTTDGRTA